MEIRTQRLGFIALAFFLLPLAGLATLIIAAGILQRGQILSTVALTLAGIALLAVCLNGILPIIKPRRLVFSTTHLNYYGILSHKSWAWSELTGVAAAYGGAKVYLKIAASSHKRAHQFFVGPFWPGGSDRIIELTRNYGNLE